MSIQIFGLTNEEQEKRLRLFYRAVANIPVLWFDTDHEHASTIRIGELLIIGDPGNTRKYRVVKIEPAGHLMRIFCSHRDADGTPLFNFPADQHLLSD